MNNQMLLNLLNTFCSSDPGSAVKIFILCTPVRQHLMRELTDEQTKWLGQHIQQDPGAILRFMASDHGKQLTREIFSLYRASQESAPPAESPNDNFGAL